MTSGRKGPTFETVGPVLIIALFVVCFARTDFQALGYAVIVLLMVLFFLCGIMAAGAWALVNEVRRTGDDLPPLGRRVFGNAWYWMYAAGVALFVALWPWK